MNTSRIDMLCACLAVVVLLSACANAGLPTPPQTAVPTEPPVGLRCLFAGTGATLAFEGKRLNFTCEQEGENEVGLLGDIELADVGWTIEKATIGHGDAGFSLSSSEMVLVEHIELSDGTLCAFAGMGATLAFEGKRLNFICGSPEVGLLGEVRLTEDGWAIEKGVIEHGDSGFTLVSSEAVLIAALVVTPMRAP